MRKYKETKYTVKKFWNYVTNHLTEFQNFINWKHEYKL